jgi:hypothetical protein
MALYTKRIVHDVAFGSNLDLILRGMNGAANKMADAVGGGLRAIALALSTPHDNSAEVQKVIDETAKQIHAQSSALKSALDQTTTKEK